MFVGHYGVGFALKRAGSALSLGLLFFAVQFADILWPIFVLLGIEKFSVEPGRTAANPLVFLYYPFSHSLLALAIWAALAFAIFMLVPFKIWGSKLRAGLVIAIGILSHYVLDLFVHVPDLPLAGPHSTKIGLGLWNYPLASVLLELVFLWGGLWIYLRSTWGKGFWGKHGATILAVLLTILQFGNMIGTPPNNPKLIAAIGLAINVIIIALAFWVDRKRVPAHIKIINEDAFLHPKTDKPIFIDQKRSGT